jgi:hypothetical protein
VKAKDKIRYTRKVLRARGEELWRELATIHPRTTREEDPERWERLLVIDAELRGIGLALDSLCGPIRLKNPNARRDT